MGDDGIPQKKHLQLVSISWEYILVKIIGNRTQIAHL